MASFYKRKLKSGEVWYASIRLANGRWKSINTKCETKAAAREVAASIERRILLGEDPFRKDAGNESLEYWTQKYFEVNASAWSLSTVTSRKQTLRELQAVTANLPTLEHVKAFERTLQARALSPHSVNIHLRNVRAFTRWLAVTITSYAAPAVKQVKASGTEHRDYLTDAELEAVCEQAAKWGELYPAYFRFMALTGMRRGEACAFKHNWIRDGFIRIPAARTKTSKRRLVPVTTRIEKAALQLPQSGFPYNPEWISRVFAKSVRAARIERRLKLHNLRDTFAVNAIQRGVPVPVVAEILGHDPRVLLANYAFVGSDQLDAARAKLE